MSANSADWTSPGTIDGPRITRSLAQLANRATPLASCQMTGIVANDPDLDSLQFQPSGNWTNNLGIMYAIGSGVPQDFAKAASWFHESARRKGDANAQYNLGILYYNGRGVSLDYCEAARWFRKAAGQGDVRARANLGYMIETGVGVPRNEEAAHWHRDAARQGDAAARTKFSLIAFDGPSQRPEHAAAHGAAHDHGGPGLPELRRPGTIGSESGSGFIHRTLVRRGLAKFAGCLRPLRAIREIWLFSREMCSDWRKPGQPH